MSKNTLVDVWGTLGRKILASVLVDDGAVFPVNEIIGNHINWFAPKERPIWQAVRQCLDSNTPPTIEAVVTRVNGNVEPGYIQIVANLFNDDDNRHLLYNANELREIGILASARQIGRNLAELQEIEGVGNAVNRATNELSGLLASKSNRSPLAGDVGNVAWQQVKDFEGSGIKTGLKWFDELTGGLWPGMNYWVVAPYKSGKSTVMRNAVINSAQAGHSVGVFCAEGSREMFALDCQAMIATTCLAEQGLRDKALRLSGLFIKRHYWHQGVLNNQELDAIRHAVSIWNDLPILLWDTRDGIRDLTTLRYLVKRSKLEYGTRVFWADYSQLFGGAGTLFERQSSTSLAVQDIPQSEDVVFCMLSQQNEEQIRSGGESHSPGVKGGGDAAAAADFMLIPKINPDDNLMELRLKLSRHTRTGKGFHYMNPSSGLMMDKWIDVNTTQLE